MEKLGIPVTTYVPQNISAVKDDALKLIGAKLVYHGLDCVEVEAAARTAAKVNNSTYY